MRFEDHCTQSKALFGAAHPEVHIWLDAYAGSPGIGMKHRKYRHHLQGAIEAGSLFGGVAKEVAIQHIKSDLAMEGWRESDRFPADTKDYVAMGLF
jgi:hypothetical protein